MPCCWFGNKPFIEAYLEVFADCLDEMSVQNRPIKEITNDPRYKRIENSWSTSSPVSTCTKVCSKKIEDESVMHGRDGKKILYKITPEKHQHLRPQKRWQRYFSVQEGYGWISGAPML